MTDSDLQKRAAEFFNHHEAGIALRDRWERRVKNWVEELIHEENEQRKLVLQARIQCYRQVFLPEVGEGV